MTLVWCHACRRYVEAKGPAGGERVEEHEAKRGVPCCGGPRWWTQVEERALREGPYSVAGGA